ncbi:MAG: FHA domain-containing protein [Gemmatimonadaceae bacterium]|nr:FHA domain-containing protein [Gemmatimonadaceae bacterium]NUQ91581.1 FHA domain-containing protein [Gemmatimonadaceae bacterium]NUR20643.1 FHA domain-containing protein [Gemmatimonadaceae bacterium]NUS96057.1 FHA domain-containing protein [Gemmatimonadaceae bacterium]
MAVLETGGTIRELNDGETVVGSGANATWRLGGADLAARHFTVALGDGGQATVKSCSTQNVVLVNGRQLGVRPLPLADGDTIAAGTARFVYAKDAQSLRPAASADTSPAYLVDERGRVAYPLARRSVSIGRDAGSIVVVRDPQVSRFHADVRTEAGAHVLYSMGSAGTLVNGHGVAAPRVLESGDKVEIGQTTLLFVVGTLPAGVKVSSGPLPEEGDWNRRPTVSAATIDTGEHAKLRRGPPWGIIVVVVLVVVVAAWLVFAR